MSGKNGKYFDQYKGEIINFMRHCVRRQYFLHFKKCKAINNCDFCTPIKDIDSFEYLERINPFNNSIPRP